MANENPLRGNRREQILQTAMALFGNHEIAQVTTRQIAKAVGISQPSLYAHFSGLDEITVELCCRAFDLLHARTSAATRGAVDHTARLRAIGREYIAFGLDQSAAYRVAFMIEPMPRTEAELERVKQAGHRAFSVLLDACRDAVGRDDEGVHALAQSMWASVQGLVALLLARQDFPWAERELLIETHLSRICRI